MIPADYKFAEQALELGFLSSDQWEEIQSAIEEEGSLGLAEFLESREILTSQQIQQVHQKLKGGEIPPMVGDFTIVERLAKGGMGSVFKAERMGEIYAIKVILKEQREDEQLTKRFLREIQALCSLNHPNIVQVVDFGVDIGENLYFVALEYVRGRDLLQAIAHEGKMDAKKALWIVEEVAKGLDCASKNKVIHRDIKPANILLGEDGSIKITDFGLAKRLGGEQITRRGAMLGTPYYAAPEISQGEPDITVSADIYSLGISFFHILAGSPPFYEGDSMQIMMHHLMDPLPDLGEYRKDLSEELKKELVALLNKMTEKEPSKRLSPGETAQRAALILEHFFDSSPQEVASRELPGHSKILSLFDRLKTPLSPRFEKGMDEERKSFLWIVVVLVLLIGLVALIWGILKVFGG